jgi:hypothetical protein
VPKIAALAAWVGIFLCYREAARSVSIRIWQATLMPVGVTLFLYAFVRSMIVTLKQGGVIWRGTFYPLSDLRRRMVW